MNKLATIIYTGLICVSLTGTLGCDPFPENNSPPDGGTEGPDESPQDPQNPPDGGSDTTGSPESPDPGAPDTNTPDNPDSVFSLSAAPGERVQDPLVAAATRDQMRRGNVDLSFNMLRELQDGKNLAVSATSLRHTMGMVYTMAQGKTQEEIGTGLGFSKNFDSTLSALNAIDQELKSRRLDADGDQKPVIYETANRVFVDDAYTPSDRFLRHLKYTWGSGVYSTDFGTRASEALVEINGWVSEKTRGLIPQLLRETEISKATHWASVNALYFKAPWHGRDDIDTTNISFNYLDGVKGKVEALMVPSVFTSYGDGEGFEWVAMPLRGEKLELLMIIPEIGQFERVRDQLDSEMFADMIVNETMAHANIRFPTFEIKSERMDLVPVLLSQGLNTLFSEDADLGYFSKEGEADLPAPNFAVQSTVVSVNRDGVEAGAGSAAGSKDEGSDGTRRFNVDRPFIFAIHDRPSGLLLFTGQVLEPRPLAGTAR